jgi:23S rRNA (cytidine2498-2'-O)-methyltransferase
MTQFYFVLTNVEAESILKEEIRLRYPEVRLSYSRPGFITFKSEKQITFHPLFCRLWGECQGRFKKSQLLYEKAWVYGINEKVIIPPDLKELSDKTIFKKGEQVTLIIMVSDDEYWVGTYTLLAHHFQVPGEVSSVLKKEVPSRAYYKIAEAFEAYDLPFDHEELVLELGSAPGGASLFLLEQDMKVLGVDTAEMDPGVKRNINFKHLKRPFETLTENDFKSPVDWIVSDINLPPTVVLKEIYRLLGFLGPRGLVLTLKINELKHLEVISNVREQVKKFGFKTVELKYLPSHRQEILLIALHS